MAGNNVLHGVAYAFIPFLDKARAPIMALSIVHFALAALVAFGVDRFLAHTHFIRLRRIARWLIWCGAALVTLAQPSQFLVRTSS